MQYVDSGYFGGLKSASAIGAHLRVKLSSGDVAIAGDEESIGVTVAPVIATGDGVTIALKNKPGTVQVVAGGEITAGAQVFSAANGKVAASGAVFEGIALMAGADGDVIEILPAPLQKAD
jgi:hypothetical protein